MSSMSGRNLPDLMSLGLTSAVFSRKTGCPSLDTFKIAMKLVLFDIDGTLITDGGASRDAFAAALLDAFEYSGDLRRYDFSGRTDPAIAHMVLRDAGWSERDINARMPGLWEKYLHELEQHERSRVRELPGIRVLVDALRPHVTLALLTGNIERGARLKLSGPALNHYFPFGAFGSDSPRREELLPIAVQRSGGQFSGEIARRKARSLICVGRGSRRTADGDSQLRRHGHGQDLCHSAGGRANLH